MTLMTFVHPFAIFLLALAAVPILLYLLPMPRRRMAMPSLMLWQRMLRDRPASQSWRWLRTLLSCLLQLLILVLLVLAVGKPVFSPAGAGGEAAIIVLDVSASMKAPLAPDDTEHTRFDAARTIAQHIINGMPSGQRAVLMTAGARGAVVCGPTDERALIIDKLGELSCTEGRTDMKTALATALELARGEKNAEVYVLSDGAADVSDLLLGDATLRYFRIGRTIPNVGIVDFQARRGLDFPDEYQALVRMRNTFGEEKSVKLSLIMDDATVEKRTVTIAPGATVEASFPGTLDPKDALKLSPRGKGILKASVTSADAFAADDAAWGLLGRPEKLVVVLVTDAPDRFLKSALTENRSVEPYAATMQQYLAKTPGADVLIFKDQLPADVPAGNLLIVNPEKSCALFDVEGDAQGLVAADWDREHPVLAGVTLKDVYMPTARVVKPKPWAEVLAEADGKPLIVAGQESGRRIVVLTFDPAKSSLSFRVAFPVLVANAFTWLADRGDVSEREIASGSEFRLKPSTAVETLEVTHPDGEVTEVTARSGAFAVSAPTVGVYAANLGTHEVTFAANLTDATESDLAVRDELTFADRTVEGQTSGEAGYGELWLVAALLALLLLAAEWYLYHHRSVV